MIAPMNGGRQQRAWGKTDDQARQDVIDALRAAHEAGEPLTARAQQPTYQAARRAFRGGWNEALEAAFGPEARVKQQTDPTSLVRELDAVSPFPIVGLPDFMRERQVLGGRMLEIAAETMHRWQRDLPTPRVYSPCASDMIDITLLLSESLATALREASDA